ncbi:MAG: hypothetical protein ISS14_00600 [Actinobacteria bacterium]|nr:hypothetical protein [Actinomycetota bacterium]MBL7123379.1 hypothetical protein [Actinomycetota bacterium]
MKKSKKYISADFGASNGLISIGCFGGKSISIEKVYGIDNKPSQIQNTLYWDISKLYKELIDGLTKIYNSFDDIESIGIDSWGLDFGLIDKKGKLISNPISYQNYTSDNILKEVTKIIPIYKLFRITGEVTLKVNTIFQLVSMIRKNSALLKNVYKILMIPDLFNYFLSGKTFCEYSNATTTQLFDQTERKWSKSILKQLKIPLRIFPKIIYPGQIIGFSRKEVTKEIGIKRLKIVAVASHDTASAVLGLPIKKDLSRNWAYIILGTWIIAGVENNDRLILNKDSYEYGFSNEGSTYPKILFQKISYGLLLLQEFRYFWMKEENRLIDWDEINCYLSRDCCFKNFIDVTDDLFFKKDTNILNNLKIYYKKTKQNINLHKKDITQAIFEGIVFKCIEYVREIEKITENKIEIIYLSGGGSKNSILNQWISNALNKNVISGLPETTSIGNVLIQMRANNEIKDIDEGRSIVSNSHKLTHYEPEDTIKWEDTFLRYFKTIKYQESK